MWSRLQSTCVYMWSSSACADELTCVYMWSWGSLVCTCDYQVRAQMIVRLEKGLCVYMWSGFACADDPLTFTSLLAISEDSTAAFLKTYRKAVASTLPAYIRVWWATTRTSISPSRRISILGPDHCLRPGQRPTVPRQPVYRPLRKPEHDQPVGPCFNIRLFGLDRGNYLGKGNRHHVVARLRRQLIYVHLANGPQLLQRLQLCLARFPP